MRHPDTLLAELRRGLNYAPTINDLVIRLRWYGMLVTRASCALALDPLTAEQRDALIALNELAKAGRNETARVLPIPALEAA